MCTEESLQVFVEDTVACVSLLRSDLDYCMASQLPFPTRICQKKTLAHACPVSPITQCVELVMAGRHEKETADLLTAQVSTMATPHVFFRRRISYVWNVESVWKWV